MRLIDAEGLDEKAVQFPNTSIWVPIETVWDAPTIDAVPVVRCKDCWNTTEVDGCMGTVLYCHVCDRDVDGEHFCSYGERRGDTDG